MPDSLPPFVDAHAVASFCIDQNKFQSVEIKDTLKNFSKFFAEDFFERDAIEGMIALT